MKNKKQLLTTLLAMLLMGVNAWGATATETLKASTTLPENGSPEYQYTIIRTNYGEYWAPTLASRAKEQAALFAFYAVENVQDAYYIYNLTARKWLSYTTAESYSDGPNQISLSNTMDHPFLCTYYTNAKDATNTPCYSFFPRCKNGNFASRCLNWHGGATATNVLGLYNSNGSQDAGSAWSLIQENTIAKAKEKVAEMKKITAMYKSTDCDNATTALENLSGSENPESSINNIMDNLYISAARKVYYITCDTRATGRYMKFLNQDNLSISTSADATALIKLYYLNNGGFAISGLQQSRYLKAPSERDGNVTTSTSLSDAATYFFTYNETAGTNNDHINIACPASTTGYYYLHDANDTKICEWNASAGASKWSIIALPVDGALYYINSGRGDDYYFKNTGSNTIHLNSKEESNPNFMWYFIEDSNEPYKVNLYNLLDGTKWGWTDTNEGNKKIKNIDNLAGYAYTFVSSGNDTYPYALQIASSRYLSNHGGTDYDLGIYSGLNDGGTYFKIEQVAADYDIYTVSISCTSGQTATVTPTSDNCYNKGYAFSSGQKMAWKSGTTPDEKDFKVDGGNINSVNISGNEIAITCSIVTPEAGKYYRIKNASSNFDGKTIYAKDKALQADIKNGLVVPFNDATTYTITDYDLGFDDYDVNEPLQVWKITSDNKLYNPKKGSYIKNSSTLTTDSTEAKVVSINSVSNTTQYSIALTGSTQPLHANYSAYFSKEPNTKDGGTKATGANLVEWEAKANNASAWYIEPLQYYTVKILSSQYATLYLPYAAFIPEGVTAYYASSITNAGSATNGYVTLTSIDGGIIPATCGVVIKGAANTSYDFVEAGSATEISGNLLKGSATGTDMSTITGGYILYSDGKFYSCTSDILDAHKAYLDGSSIPTGAPSFTISFDDDPTGIYEMVDGQLVDKNAPVYNLAGQRVNGLQKGINIVNGKKVLY